MGAPRISVGIAGDGMRAHVRIITGPPATEAELREAIRAAGVSHGVSDDVCQRLGAALTDELFTATDVVIAEGQRAQAGKDGYFVPAFSAGIQPGHVREDGTMDFRDRELLKPVAAGASLGRLFKETPGTPGRRVDGGEIAITPPRACKLALGPGVNVLADGEIVASLAGVLLYAAERSIDVVQHHVHTGSVDLRSGHLDMEGSLIVRGSIERLFHASASGDVEIQGGIEYGSVRAGGSLRVSSGVRGGETGMVSAEGDISIRYAEYAHVVCGGLLKLESAVNSELTAQKIQVTGKLRGGKARAEQSVVVGEAGVSQGVSTALAAAQPIERPVLDAKRAIGTAKEQRQLVHKSTRSDERGKGGKAGRAAATIASAELERKIALAKRRDALLPDAFIEISGKIHAGVTIQIGAAALMIDEPSSRVRFSYDPLTRQVRAERFVR